MLIKCYINTVINLECDHVHLYEKLVFGKVRAPMIIQYFPM